MIGYAYATQWNSKTGRPTCGHKWLSETEARSLFERPAEIEVVRVKRRRESDGAVRAAWVMGFAGRAGVRVQWLNDKHSVKRVSDFDVIDGRLFRRVSVDYAYPDKEHWYSLAEATAMSALTVFPDGTGHARKHLTSEPTEFTAKIEGFPTDNLWIDYPEFGHWEALADPNFGMEPPK